MPDNWKNIQKLKKVYDRHVKSRKIPNTTIDWPNLFYDWCQQESSIIQFPLILQKIYPPNYILQEKELWAWWAMFRACGCTNVMPFPRKESSIEFWSRAPNLTADKETLESFYKNNMIKLDDPISDSNSDQNNSFWSSFWDALSSGKRGADGKIRILSIIALNFQYIDLKKVSYYAFIKLLKMKFL
jgi:hypothetical protein